MGTQADHYIILAEVYLILNNGVTFNTASLPLLMTTLSDVHWKNCICALTIEILIKGGL